jgi:hypothetical protein
MISSENISFLTTSKTPANHGIAFPVINGTGGFFTRTNGLQTIMSGLKQLILTNKGERVMKYDFGTNIRKYVFEPFNESLRQDIVEEITEAVRKYEPRVDILSLDVTSQEGADRTQIFISLRVAPKGDILTSQVLDLVV